MCREGLLLGKGLGFAYRALRGLHAASALGGDRAHEGCSVILDLAIHLVVRFDLDRSDEGDRMRCTGCSSGSHGGYVGGFEDKYSRRAGMPACGRHIDDDWHGRAGNLLDDLARRADETSGSIHFDQHSLGVATLSFVDGAGDVLRADGLDRVIDD